LQGGYRGEQIEKTKRMFGWILEIVLRSDSTQGFQVLPRRWIVERTFSWFESYRRPGKDYEYNTDTARQ
jgi:putative transposase